MANWLAQHLEQSDRLGWPVQERDRHSVHFRRPDGAIEAEIATHPLHYRNEHGVWQPIDTALVRSTRGGREYRVDGVPVSVQADGLVSITGSKHQQRTRRLVIFDVVKQQVVKTLAEFGDGIAVDDCLLRGSDNFRHTLQVLPDGLREDVTISDAIGGVRASEWLMMETEIMGVSWPDGWIKALPPVGDYHFPPPTLKDATGRRLMASMYTQRQNGGGQLLYSGVPLALLGGLRFPVVLDPTFEKSVVNGWLGQSNTSYLDARGTYSGDGSDLMAGQKFVAGKTNTWSIYRGRIELSTPSIVFHHILSVVLRLATSATYESLADTIEVTSLDAASDYFSAPTADFQANWRSAGAAITAETYYDSGALDTTYFVSSPTYYGVLGYKDRNVDDPDGPEEVIFSTTNLPLLVVVYDDLFPSAYAGVAICRTSGSLAALPAHAGGSSVRTALPSIAGVSYG